MMKKARTTLLLGGLFLFSTLTLQAEEESDMTSRKIWWAVSPVIGMDRNELTRRGPGGQTFTETDTAPEYGLFAMMAHPNLVVNNFLFFSRVNDCDVWGDLLYANYYISSQAPATWHAGAGYLYHQIKPDNNTIEVKVPMLKTGPHFRIKPLRLTLTPYFGYAWERVNTDYGDSPNDSWIYGLRTGWRWRMLEANINYYYQDSLQVEQNYHTLHARLHVFFTKNVGLLTRVDYMEHQTTTDTSFLMGPTVVW